jgi:5-hydroxyisourate hydrolase-like protein (transthyretin family)
MVVNAKGQPAADIRVVLAPERERRNEYCLYRTTTTNREGRFDIGGISPGAYLLLASDRIEAGGYWSPGFVKALDKFGQAISLTENSHLSKRIVIPAE